MSKNKIDQYINFLELIKIRATLRKLDHKSDVLLSRTILRRSFAILRKIIFLLRIYFKPPNTDIKFTINPNINSVIPGSNTNIISYNSENKTIGFIHAFYLDLTVEILELTRSIKNTDFFITTSNQDVVNYFVQNFGENPNYKLLQVENHGRDVLPFVKSLRFLDLAKYTHFFKIHTKKSKHLNGHGNYWFFNSVYSILGSLTFYDFLHQIDKESLILCGFEKLPVSDHFNENKIHLSKLIPDFINLNKSYFIPGTMFFGTSKFLSLIKSINFEDHQFEMEEGQLDSTFAHALERYFGYLCFKMDGAIFTYNEFLSAKYHEQ